MKKKLKRDISGYFECLNDYIIEDRGDFVCASDLDNAQPFTLGVYIKEVIYNDPVTIVLWSDGTKTISKTNDGDTFSREAGLTICIIKKMHGTSFTRNLFEDWSKPNSNKITVSDVRKSLKVNKVN